MILYVCIGFQLWQKVFACFTTTLTYNFSWEPIVWLWEGNTHCSKEKQIIRKGIHILHSEKKCGLNFHHSTKIIVMFCVNSWMSKQLIWTFYPYLSTFLEYSNLSKRTFLYNREIFICNIVKSYIKYLKVTLFTTNDQT